MGPEARLVMGAEENRRASSETVIASGYRCDIRQADGKSDMAADGTMCHQLVDASYSAPAGVGWGVKVAGRV